MRSRTWHTAYALTFFLFTYLLNKLNLRKELFTSDFSRFCWWAAHILDQCGAYLPDFWLPAPAPLCLRALSGCQSQLFPCPEMLGAQWHISQKWRELWMNASLPHVSCVLSAASQVPRGIEVQSPTVIISLSLPFIVSISCSLTSTAKQTTCTSIPVSKSASRRPQTKTNKCTVHEHTSVHEFRFCCLPMYWLFRPASEGPHWWCRKNWVCYLSQ